MEILYHLPHLFRLCLTWGFVVAAAGVVQMKFYPVVRWGTGAELENLEHHYYHHHHSSRLGWPSRRLCSSRSRTWWQACNEETKRTRLSVIYSHKQNRFLYYAGIFRWSTCMHGSPSVLYWVGYYLYHHRTNAYGWRQAHQPNHISHKLISELPQTFNENHLWLTRHFYNLQMD